MTTTTLRDEIKQKLVELVRGQKEINESLPKIARKVEASVATVHRAVKELEEENVIKTIPSKLRTKPNRIVYLGDPVNEVPPSETKKDSELVLSNLIEHLEIKQSEIDRLRSKLEDYENNIVKVVNVNDMDVIFKKHARREA